MLDVYLDGANIEKREIAYVESEEKLVRTGSIYIIKNRVNNKVYIGQTTMTVHERFMTHMKPSTAKQKRGYKLYSAIKKYGSDNFYVETLESGIDICELDRKEIEYIAKYDSYYNGYNSTKGGDGRIINIIENEEDLLSAAMDGIPATELARIFAVNIATVYRTLHKLGFYYNDRDEEAIISDIMSGMKQRDVADKYDVDKVTVQRILRKNGIRLHRERVDMRDTIDIEQIRADYQSQLTIEQICQKHNLSKTTFYRLKKQYAFQTRTQIYSDITKNYDVIMIGLDYAAGMKVNDICRKHGISIGSLYRVIRENSFRREK